MQCLKISLFNMLISFEFRYFHGFMRSSYTVQAVSLAFCKAVLQNRLSKLQLVCYYSIHFQELAYDLSERYTILLGRQPS